MGSEILVSVVIPSFNMADYLPFAIQSVLDQSYDNYEVVIVDDGSTDNTKEVVEKFLVNEKVNYFYQENCGLACARNAGIKVSNGEFIALCDADDVWSTDKLEKQMPGFAGSENIGVVYTNAAPMSVAGEKGEPFIAKRYSGKITGKLLINNFVSGSASIIRRKCFDEVGFYDQTLTTGEDYDLWLRISTKYEYLYIDIVTYFYRSWEGQMSKNYRRMIENGIKIMEKFLSQNPGIVEQEIVNEAWAHTYVVRGKLLFVNEDNKMSALKDYLKALGYKRTYIPAWKAIIKLILNRKS